MPKLTRGVSLLQPLIGNLVDCCSVGASMGGAVAFILFLRTANILNCVRVHVCPCLITCDVGEPCGLKKKRRPPDVAIVILMRMKTINRNNVLPGTPRYYKYVAI